MSIPLLKAAMLDLKRHSFTASESESKSLAGNKPFENGNHPAPDLESDVSPSSDVSHFFQSIKDILSKHHIQNVQSPLGSIAEACKNCTNKDLLYPNLSRILNKGRPRALKGGSKHFKHCEDDISLENDYKLRNNYFCECDEYSIWNVGKSCNKTNQVVSVQSCSFSCYLELMDKLCKYVCCSCTSEFRKNSSNDVDKQLVKHEADPEQQEETFENIDSLSSQDIAECLTSSVLHPSTVAQIVSLFKDNCQMYIKQKIERSQLYEKHV